MDERGGAKSQTGREISCQPQYHRQGEEGRGGESDGLRNRGRDWRGGIRIVRGVVVETVKEGGSKAPGFSRDLCEIPAMPRVKKKTALRCANLYLYSFPRSSFIPLFPSSLRVVLWKWKWLERIVPSLEISRFQGDGKKDSYIQGTDPDWLAPLRSDLPGHGN